MRTRILRVALGCCLAVARALPAQQEIPADRTRIADAVRADLAKLTDLERAYFAANKRYTTEIKSLNFTPASGAAIIVSYASARTFSASGSHFRLAPFLCFVIVSSTDEKSPAEKPFCTDSRYLTAASSLARGGEGVATPVSPAPRASTQTPLALNAPSVTPVTTGSAPIPAASPPVLTPGEFATRLETATGAKSDSVVVIVQFAVKDARYDPSRGVLEVALERVPMPLTARREGDPRPPLLALACFTRPAFVCGESGLTYIARDLLRVPRARAPDAEVLRSGLTLQARFAIGRRDDTPRPSLTLLALLLQAKGAVVSRWDSAVAR